MMVNLAVDGYTTTPN